MASGASIRAGEAFVEGTFRDEKLVAGLRAWQSKLRSAANTARSIGLQLGAAGAAIAGPILVSLNTYRKLGAELDDMAKRTGIAADKLSEIRFAASQSGTDLATFETAVKTMQKTLLEAEQGGAKAVETLERLGLSVEDLRGLSGDEQFAAIARQLNRIEEPGLKAAMALRIFGRSGQALVPMISELEQLTRAANELGLVMDPEAAAKAAELDDAMDVLAKTFESTRAAIGAAVAPLATDFLGAVTRVTAQATSWVNANQQLVGTVAAVGAALVATGSGVSALGAGMHVIVLAIEDVIKAKKAFNAIMEAGLAGATASFAGVALAVGAIVTATLAWWSAQKRVNQEVEAASRAQLVGDPEKIGLQATRFEQLAAKGTSLTAAELAEAKSLTAAVGAEFGFTSSFDEAAGGFTDGTRDVATSRAARSRRSVAAIDAEIAERRKTMTYDPHRVENIPDYQARLAKEQAAIDELLAKRQVTLAINRSEGERPAPLAPDVTANAAAAEQRAQEIADAQERIEDELAQARIEAMQDGLKKELAAIAERERQALRELEQSGLFEGDALDAAKSQIRGRFSYERDGARMAAAGETSEEITRRSKERAAEIEAIDDQLARAKIAAMEEGLDKELALIAQREQEARRELEQSELFSGEQLAEMLAKLDATFGLEREVANRENASVELASAGTFQGALADQQLGRQSVAEEHLKWIREFTKRTADKVEKNDGGVALDG